MTSKEYWEKRAERFVKMEKSDADKAIRQFRFMYDSMISEIQKEIDAFVGRYATAEGLSLADVRKLLTKSELSSFKSSVKDYARIARTIQNKNASAYYYDLLRKLALKVNISRLEALKTEITSYVMKLGIEEEKLVEESMNESYKEAYYRSMYDMQQFEGIGKRIVPFQERLINTAINEQWLGDNYSGRIWNNKQKLISDLETVFVRGVAINADPDELSRTISKSTGTSFRNSQRLVYTELAHIIETARKSSYKDYGVTKYQFVATLDDRTSILCASTDGMIFNVKDAVEGVNWPPLHPWCRSTTVPYFEPMEGEQEGTRFARDRRGRAMEVPASMTYKEWKKKYID